jgi:hypothetical protein
MWLEVMGEVSLNLGLSSGFDVEGNDALDWWDEWQLCDLDG